MQTGPKLAQYLLNDNTYHRSNESKEHILEIVLMCFSARGPCSLITSLQEAKPGAIHQQGVSLERQVVEAEAGKLLRKLLEGVKIGNLGV